MPTRYCMYSVCDILSNLSGIFSMYKKIYAPNQEKRHEQRAPILPIEQHRKKTTKAYYSSQYMFIIRDVYRKVCELLLA